MALSFCVSGLGAQSTPKCRVPEFPAPELCARAGLDTLRASYIVVLDESGSMRPLWALVRVALATFIRGVPDGDEIDIRGFSGSTRRINLPVPLTASTRIELVRQVEGLPVPNGAYTDLGLAVSEALAIVEAAPSERQHFTYVLTDGAHYPPPGSTYAKDGSGSWGQLRERAATLAKARPLSFALLRLTNEADQQGFIAKTLPNVDVVSALSSEQLQQWFSREARSVALRKLKLRIAEERRRPAFFYSASEDIAIGGRAAGTQRALRRTLATTLTEDVKFTLDDGTTIVVRAAKPAAPNAVFFEVGAPNTPWYLPPSGVHGAVSRTVAVHASLGPRAELERIGELSTDGVDSVRVELALRGATIGRVIAYWASLLVVIIVALVGARQLKRKSHRASLAGQVRISGADGVGENIDLAQAHNARYEWRNASGKTLASLEARNERGQTKLWVVPRVAGLTMGGLPCAKPTRIRGTTRLEYAGDELHFFPTVKVE